MDRSTHARRGTPARALVTGVLSLMLFGAFAAGASAQVALSGSPDPLPGSSFEGGDGNQVVNDPLNVDWATAAGVRHFADPVPDEVFTEGSKEDEPGLWVINPDGSPSPPKNNIFDAYALLEEAGGDTFLHLAFTRENDTGTTFMAFELNQRADTWNNGQTETEIACRTTGDIIVTLQVQGNDPSVILQRWVSTASAANGCATAGTLEDFTNFTDNVDAQGAVNDAAIPNFLPASVDWPGDMIGANLFVEASLNLSTILEDVLGTPCFSFGSIWMHTRASLSDDSNLDDLISPEPLLVRNCTASGVKYHDLNANGTRDAGEPGLAGFRIWADYDNDGARDADEPFDDTDATGAYSIVNIQDPSGTYSLREQLTPPASDTGGWICSQPTTTGTNGDFPCAYIGIDGGATPNVTGKDFGNYKKATITVVKDRISDDPKESGTFNLIVDADTVATGGDGATGSKEVVPGAHVVSETGAGGTVLGRYASEVSCDNGASGAGTSLNVSVNSGQQITCTIKNTRILNPSIHVDKKVRNAGDAAFVDGPIQTTRGRTLEYQFIVTNPGDVALAVVVSDPRCDAGTLSGPAGAGTEDKLLDPGEAWTYTCSHVVTATDPNPLPNTVTATGTVPGRPPVSDTDSAVANIIEQVILPEAGSARLRGPSGCVRGPFTATVRGTRITSVTFFVDGKRVKRLTAPNGEGTRFSVSINPRGRGFGVHRVTARVTFASDSGTRARTLRLSFQRCKRQTVGPRFTG